MDPPLPRFLYKKIKTPAINKPPRIIRRPLTFSIFCLFSSALPLFFSHLKHSYLDRETSLILKSIAGKPSHLLTKVTSSYTRFLSFSLHVCALLCSSLLLFCFACVYVEKSILRGKTAGNVFICFISQPTREC